MSQEVKVVARTVEVDGNKWLNEDLTLLAGKAAGVCYMPDNYMEEGIQNLERAMKRAENTSKSGHHSVYDHGHVTMVIKTNKMMAMLLNSIGVYTTSEKSARYTVMKPETELELKLYEKWTDLINKAILEFYPDMDEKSANKLAMENARYMISVFTPTTMMYTISFRQAFLIIDYLEKLCEDCGRLPDVFSKRLLISAKELAEQFKEQIGESRLHDNKNQGFRFLEYQNFKKETEPKKDVIGDSYTTTYIGSFAMLAQAQRHRTLRYTMFFNGDDKMFGYYVPHIVDKAGLHDEWLEDINSVSYCYPQGTLIRITEQGIFEDFALKCKERLCGRAQLEITTNTVYTLCDFIVNKDHLCEENQMLLGSMIINDRPCARCMFKDFTCTEGCRWGAKYAFTRLI